MWTPQGISPIGIFVFLALAILGGWLLHSPLEFLVTANVDIMCFLLIMFVQFAASCDRFLIHFYLITNIVLLGEHRPLHQRCDFEEPGGSFSGHLRAGSEPDLHPDGERLLRSLPAVWAVSGTPQVNWLAQLQGDFTVIENTFKVFNIHFLAHF